MLPALRHPACAVQQRRLQGTGSPKPPSSRVDRGSGLHMPSRGLWKRAQAGCRKRSGHAV